MAEDFDHDVNDLVDKDDFRNIQPHLGSLEFKDPSALEQINPAFEDDIDEAGFGDKKCTSKSDNQSLGTHTNGSSNEPLKHHGDETPSPTTDISETSHIASYPVVYSNNGQNGVVQEQVVIRSPDGTKVIRTEPCCHYDSHPYRKKRRPLRKNRILLLKVLSVIAVIVYFPLGIPAAYFAFRIQKEFDAGIISGNIDKAQKYAGRAEKLIIFAGLFAILTLVVVVSLVDRLNSSDDDNSTLSNRILPG